jgi:hypothetical protein
MGMIKLMVTIFYGGFVGNGNWAEKPEPCPDVNGPTP